MTTRGLFIGHKSMIAHVAVTRGRLTVGVGSSTACLVEETLALTNDGTGVLIWVRVELNQ